MVVRKKLSDYWNNHKKHDKKESKKYRTQGYAEYHRKKIKNAKKFVKGRATYS
jgi:hypothetical protein